MDFKDYYKILGVEPTADDKAIKAAYRKLARKYHPDVSKEKDAEAKFKDASEAYEALKSADKRAEYDDLRRYGQHGQPFQGTPGGQRGRFRRRRSDTATSRLSVRSLAIAARFRWRRGRQSHSAGREDKRGMELAVFLEETLRTSRKGHLTGAQSNGRVSTQQHSESMNVKTRRVWPTASVSPKGRAHGRRWRCEWRSYGPSFCAAPIRGEAMT